MKRVTTVASALLAGALLMVIPYSHAQLTTWFSESFETSPQGTRYGFEWLWPGEGRYAVTHMSTGGWDGRGAAHVLIRAGTSQYNLGWIISPLNRTFTVGDSMYIRFRIRFDDNYPGFQNRDAKNKFILIGQTTHDTTIPNSRVLVYIHPPNDQFGCTLGQVDYLNNTGPFPWATTAYFGLSGSWFSAPNYPIYGSIGPYVNINWIGNCAPPALVARGNLVNAPAPGPNSARPVNGWYHFQIQAQSGNPGQGAFRMWVNNNNFGAPTSAQIGLRDGLWVTGWGNSQLFVGGYQDEPPAHDLGYRLDDFQLGPSFDATWYPGGGGTVRPSPGVPTNVHIIR